MRQSTQKFITRALASLLVVVPFALQQGCGGGGGGSSKPAAPTLAMTVQATKTFHFTWNDVSGETEYRLMENPDGTSGYTQGPTIAADATQHDLVVSLPLRINARYILQACNSKGCTDSNEVVVSGNLAAGIGYFKASDPTNFALFGNSVALSADGNVLAVGADWVDRVYVFRKSDGLWAQQTMLSASNGESGDGFGGSLALSADGSVLAVGAPGEDGSSTNPIEGPDDNAATDSGSVYLFRNSAGFWVQGYIKAPNAATRDRFGSTVALSADGATLAVGAPVKNGAAGAAYVFGNNGSTWAERAYITASNGEALDRFGSSVALSGDGTILVAGANGEDGNAVDGPGNNEALFSGAVYVFSDSGSGWNETYIKASNTHANAFFGHRVALSTNGTTLAVSANGDSGAVYLFSKNSNGWGEQTYVTASNGKAGDSFGETLAISSDGGYLAVGAPGEDGGASGINGDPADGARDSGGAYLYSNQSGRWTQQAYIKASNTGEADAFGTGVALSMYGETLAIGASGENGGATGINGDQMSDSVGASGAVYLY